MLGLLVQNQSHRAGTHLRGKLLRRIAHQTFFSGEMVSANPGAVHFRDNDIDGEILFGMTAEDLKELGISSFGHRRKLLNAITALGGEPPTFDVAQSATSATSA